jgi:hypothetical protein
VVPASHAAQRAPLTPHEGGSEPDRHSAESQQPRQFDALQKPPSGFSQRPFTQADGAAQGAHAFPPLPQPVEV